MYKHIKNILITWLLLLSVGAFASTEITLNSTVDGAWTEDSYSDKYGYKVEYYSFTLTEAKNIVLKIYSTSGGEIKLKNDQNKILEHKYFQDDKSIIFSKYLKAGTYTIRIRLGTPNLLGTFILTYKENQPKHTQPISLGKTLQGSLTENSYLDLTGRRAEYYSFTLEKDQGILIDSNASYFQLKDAQGKTIESRYYSHISKYLEAGDYLIKVSSHSLDNFTLSLNNKDININIKDISLGETKTVELTENSYVDDYRDYAEYYSFTLDTAQDIIFHYNAIGNSQYWSTMQLQNSKGYPIASESYGDSFAKYLEAGDYIVKISYSLIRNFTLTIKTNDKHIQPISLENTIHGEITKNSYLDTVKYTDSDYGPYDIKYRVEYYTFTLDKTTSINISSNANFEGLLEVKNTQGQILKHTDATGSFTKSLEAGTYTIKIYAYNRFMDTRNPFHFTLKINDTSKYAWLIPAVYTPMLLLN